jgi:hypothetical protein
MTSDAHANEVGKPSATVAAVAVAIPPANAGNRRFADWHEQVAANQSRGVASEAAGILDWAPASTGLRSAQVLEKRASSDAVKTVKRETAQLGGAAAQAKAPRAPVAPRRKPRATEQPGALAQQMCWKEVQFQMERALSCRGSFRFTRGFFFAIRTRNLARRFRRRVRRVDSWRPLRCRSRRGQFFATCFGQLFVFGR